MGVIGTAGHVDHGKSTLVHALTGIDPDRLQEEKEREMTIDLGFAWLDLPGGERVGLVDVPGHKDFIKNMLSGVGGIDAALFVVAADEGVMPQTREHLHILDLLQVKAGVIALTKIDLVDDPDWFELVEADLLEQLEGTVLESAPIIRVSARKGVGLDELKGALADAMHSIQANLDRGRGRLPIDRIFTIAGFGTVVTGTLLDGVLKAGDEIEVQPSGLKGRIRGLQSHNEKQDRAQPGTRVALNLTGLSLDQIQRGDVVAVPGVMRGTTMVDASLRYLSDAPVPLKHNLAVDFFTGAAEVPAQVRLLSHDVLQPGQSGWVQLRLSRPVAALKGDRFILRLPSPSITIGGGEIVDPHPRRRHRRLRPEVIQHLERLAFGTPVEQVVHSLETSEPATIQELKARSALSQGETEVALRDAVSCGEILSLVGDRNTAELPPPNTLVLSRAGWARMKDRLDRLLEEYHRQHPLRRGMPREELKSRLGLSAKSFNAILAYAAREGTLEESNSTVRLPSHRVAFSAEQQTRIDDLLAQFRQQPYTPPSLQDVERALGPELLSACLEGEILMKLNDDVVYLPQTYDEMQRRIVDFIQEHGSITVAQVRDLFGASRRYALALTGYLDQVGITRRVGDERVLR